MLSTDPPPPINQQQKHWISNKNKVLSMFKEILGMKTHLLHHTHHHHFCGIDTQITWYQEREGILDLTVLWPSCYRLFIGRFTQCPDFD